MIRLANDTAAVLYLRMSDERQERSITDQRTELRAYAAKQGYTIVREYVDSAISGDDTTRRTEFLRMREDSQGGEFSIVLAWDQDRFGRFDPIEGGHWILPFRNAGVRLETIAQGKIDWNDFAGRLIYLVQQEGKHAYLRDLSRNSIRGSIQKAKEGAGADGSAPYGYRLVDGRREISEPEASVVRRIFELYLDHRGGLRHVANCLTAERIPSPQGKKWATGTIFRILRNRKYLGDYIWGKEAKGRYHSHQAGEIAARSKTDRRLASSPIVHKQRFDAIIDRETFDRAQRLLDERKTDTSPTRNKSDGYLLTGIVRCRHCGSAMSGHRLVRKGSNAKRYICAGYWFGGKAKCSMNWIPETPLINAILRLIEERYLSDEAIGRIREAIERKLSSPKASADTKAIKRKIAALDRRLDQGTDRVLSAPPGLVASIYAKLDAIREEREQLQGRLHAVGSQDNARSKREALVEEALDGLRNLRQSFHKADKAACRQLLRSLVSKVELSFTQRQHRSQTRTHFDRGTIYLRPDRKLSSLLRLDGGP